MMRWSHSVSLRRRRRFATVCAAPMTELEQQLQSARAEAEAALAACADLPSLDQLKARFLGRSGVVSAALEQLGKLPKEEKPRIGKMANEVKRALEAAMAAKREELEAKTVASGP